MKAPALASSVVRSARAATAALLLVAIPLGSADAQPAPAGPTSPATAEPSPSVPAEPKAPPSNFWMAVLEGPIGVNLVMNVGGRLFKGEDSYDSTFETWFDNIGGEWEYDPNAFGTNQLAHPYQGSFYHTAARSLGNGFYTSFLLTTFGAWLWETAGEIHPPSVNDQITTSVAGSLLGESLFRLSTISLGAADYPSFWRRLGATAISPMNGFNRLAYGNKYRDRRLNGIPYYGELIGTVGVAGEFRQDGASVDADENTFTLAGRITHGIPGAPGWRFRRPFDHFDSTLSLTINRNSLDDEAFGSILIRGLILGKHYGEGTNAGLWGMFAAYDFIAPQVFRASSSNVSFGTVGQRALGSGFTLSGTVYAGVGFGAGGVSEDVEDKRDYHFGAQGVGLGELGLTWAQRVRLRGGARVYLIGEKLSPDADSYEDIQYGLAELVYRVAGSHAVAIEYTGARRKARYPDVPDTKMSVHEMSLSYRFVSDRGLGVAR